MNKKVNTLLFLLAGTIINIVLMMGIFLILLFLGNLIISPETNSSIRMLIFLLIISLSVIVSFFLYSKLVKFITKKWNLEKWIYPLFSSRK